MLALSLFTFLPGVGNINEVGVNTAPSKSVEINIAELSPRGEDGGYAVPASACAGAYQVCTGQTDGCYWVCPPTDTGNCVISDNSVTVGETVVRTANTPSSVIPVTYTYSWTGSDGLTGTTKSVSKVYTTAGTKTGSVTVRSGAGDALRTATYQCPAVTVTAPAAPTVRCSVSPTTINVGGSARWTAVASGGNGTYTYQWQGTDSLAGTTAAVNKVYNTPGTKTGSVRVTSNGRTSAWTSCTNSVNVRAPVTLDLTADEYLIDIGDSTTLRWTTTNATYCTASNGWSGNRVPNSSQSTGALMADRTYNMICYNGTTGQASTPDTVTVRVRDIEGRIDPCDGDHIVRQDEDFCLEYEVNNPAQCVIRLGTNTIVPGPLSTSGQFTWSLNSQGRFVLYCNGAEIDDATIKVLPEFEET